MRAHAAHFRCKAAALLSAPSLQSLAGTAGSPLQGNPGTGTGPPVAAAAWR